MQPHYDSGLASKSVLKFAQRMSRPSASLMPNDVLWPEPDRLDFLHVSVDETSNGPVMTVSFAQGRTRTFTVTVVRHKWETDWKKERTPQGRRYHFRVARDGRIEHALVTASGWEYQFRPDLRQARPRLIRESIEELIDSLEAWS